jgi:hypothetical protein
MLEYNFNPFIIFNPEKRVVSLNNQAQYLLSSVKPSQIFDLASSYAPKSYGFRDTFIDIEFGKYKFFGIQVGYVNDEQLAIMLYKKTSQLVKSIVKANDKTNLYSIIDLSISVNKIKSKALFKKTLDPTFPEVYISANTFVKLLSSIYELFIHSEEIETKLYIKTGEYLKVNSKKYTLASLEILGNTIQSNYKERLVSLEHLLSSINIELKVENECEVVLIFPLIFE